MKVRIEISDSCNLCGLCVDLCPMQVFEIVQSQLYVYDEHCIYCRGCEVFCPQKAINLLPMNQTLKFKEVRTLSD